MVIGPDDSPIDEFRRSTNRQVSGHVEEISVLELTGGGVHAFTALELQTWQYASIKPRFVI